MANWVVTAKRADFSSLANKFHIDPVTARILVNRDIKEDEMDAFLHPSLDKLHEPGQMKDMERAVSFIAKNLHRRIRIIGDYDIDGICSTYLLLSAIRACGGTADYAIPRRIEDGYGINPQMVEEAKRDGIEIILTCDNGIAAHPAAKKAKELSLTMIITDHHQVPFEETKDGRMEMISPAYAVVDPHQRDCGYPYPEICGGMVAWKFLQLLFEKMGKPKEEALSYIEFAAFATVGDIMPLVDENRTVVSFGLKAMAKTKNVGLAALLKETGLWGMPISAYHLGFVIGPCFNAAGRLATADLAVELLLETDAAEAEQKAKRLVELNDARKAMTNAGDEAAKAMLSDGAYEGDRVLVIYLPDLHESLCGLVAGHIKEAYGRPTFVLCDGKDFAKGSGRSIEAYSMFEKMNECKDLLVKFGGHPMAAGLSIRKEDIDEFRRRMNENAGICDEDLVPKVKIDVPMPLSYLREELILELERLEPFGAGNEKPAFAESGVSIAKISRIGKERQFLKFAFVSGGVRVDGLYFGDAGVLEDDLKAAYSEGDWQNALLGRPNAMALTILYYPQINEYQGRRSIQVIVSDYKIWEA